MKVEIKDLHVAMEIRNRGMELRIRDNQGKHLGDLIVSKSKIEWCQGQTRAGNGKTVRWNEFIEWMANK